MVISRTLRWLVRRSFRKLVGLRARLFSVLMPGSRLVEPVVPLGRWVRASWRVLLVVIGLSILVATAFCPYLGMPPRPGLYDPITAVERLLVVPEERRLGYTYTYGRYCAATGSARTREGRRRLLPAAAHEAR